MNELTAIQVICSCVALPVFEMNIFARLIMVLTSWNTTRFRKVRVRVRFYPFIFTRYDKSSCYKTNGKRAACNYRVMDARERLLSTREA